MTTDDGDLTFDALEQSMPDDAAAQAMAERQKAEELNFQQTGEWLSERLRNDTTFTSYFNAVLALRNGVNSLLRWALAYADTCETPLPAEQMRHLLPCVVTALDAMTEVNADPQYVIPSIRDHAIPQLSNFDRLLWAQRKTEVFKMANLPAVALSRQVPTIVLGTQEALTEFLKQLRLQLQADDARPLLTAWLSRENAHQDRVCNNRARILTIGSMGWSGMLTKPGDLLVLLRGMQARLSRELDLVVAENARGIASTPSAQGLCKKIAEFGNKCDGRMPWQIYCWQTNDSGTQLPQAGTLAGVSALHATLLDGVLTVEPLA